MVARLTRDKSCPAWRSVYRPADGSRVRMGSVGTQTMLAPMGEAPWASPFHSRFAHTGYLPWPAGQASPAFILQVQRAAFSRRREQEFASSPWHGHEARPRADEEEGVLRGCLSEQPLSLLFAAIQKPPSVATKLAAARRVNLVLSWLPPPEPFLVPCTVCVRGVDGEKPATLKGLDDRHSLVARRELPGFQNHCRHVQYHIGSSG
ncbi:hypothetical protein MRX96_055077 [Rhipicephalus microplus]